MRAVEIIEKKRDKLTLTEDEIKFFISGVIDGNIPDYQTAAWLMAILLNGMTYDETTCLTLAMADSGEKLDLSSIAPVVVDKHSTGGVGDKTTLVIAPIVAACGLPVGKMSGRGLGFSGGTLDKLESIPGLRVNLNKNEFLDQLGQIGLVISGQSADLAPADGKLYALRDVTATVPSLPLIASSIMSKKIASGAHAIVLDVKVGNGAFMKDLDQARQLAQTMIAIGELSNRRVSAVLSDMNQPLGNAVGNAVELVEAIETLKGNAPPDFKEHCLTIASHMLMLGNKSEDMVKARTMVEEALNDLSAWKKFREFVEVQGGDLSAVDHFEKLPTAPFWMEVFSKKAGFLSQVHAQKIGEAAVGLGAGRVKKGDPIDLSVGVIVRAKVGDFVEINDPLFKIYSKNKADADIACEQLLDSIVWSNDPVEPLPLFYDTIQ